MTFPSKCPYCGKDNLPNRVAYATDHKRNSIELHNCLYCGESIFLIKSLNPKQKKPFREEIISYYPILQQVDLPERIKELSPIAYKTFGQTLNAKEHNYDMLVGAGLRIALEWLVWDYLTKVKNYTDDYLGELKLYKRIELMNDDAYKDVCTRLIRWYGNDCIHIKKTLDFTDDEAIEVFHCLCDVIDIELRTNEISERLQKQSTPK